MPFRFPFRSLIRGVLRGACLSAGCCGVGAWAAVITTPARPAPPKKQAATTQWAQAERGREALEAMPGAGRTKADYLRAIAAYRAIYFGNPGDVHAAVSVNAVAELLAEQGRDLRDAKSSRAAVKQYEFLRTQYPGSSLRVQALLAEAQIEQNDLNDAAAARAMYQQLLKEYANSQQAEEARAGLVSLKQGAGPRVHGPGKSLVAMETETIAVPTRTNLVATNAVPNLPDAPDPAIDDESALPAMPPTSGAVSNVGTSAIAERAVVTASLPAGRKTPLVAEKKETTPVVCVVPAGKAVSPAAIKAAAARAAVPTADGQTSMVRALGLKVGRIVIDAGHGGHDSGTLGVDGIQEKDVVLEVALRLGKLLHERLGAQIVYTRSDDTFIPLEERTAMANKAQADLFLSIHANSSPDADARGVETYYLNFTSDATALDVAARENAASDQSVHQLGDLVKKIALKDKIAESRELAADVEQSLYGGLQRGNAGLKDRGVKKAPFVVLIGAKIPSILAEISFVSNAKDASQMRQPDYLQRIAESLYKGVAKYEAGLSGTRIPAERAPVERASAERAPAGQ
jgi:N-acetylmuramoyl-L-alanine amidase